jgi:plasmid stabilization system protein ParE
MTPYQLSPDAFRDLEDILIYIGEKLGHEHAARLEDKLFATFIRLAHTPELGHRRQDLASRHPVLFYLVDPYLVAYQRDRYPLPIHAILHSSRDVRSVLGRRIL